MRSTAMLTVAIAAPLLGSLTTPASTAEIIGDGTLERYELHTADRQMLCPNPSVAHENPFPHYDVRRREVRGYVWCRWAGGDYVDDPSDDVTTSRDGRLSGYAVIVADSDLLEIVCFDPIARGTRIICDDVQSDDFFKYLRAVEVARDMGREPPARFAAGDSRPLGEGLRPGDPPQLEPPTGCQVGNALLRVEPTYPNYSSDDWPDAEPALEGAILTVTDYGENVRVVFNRPALDHRTVGVRVARLSSFDRSLYVARHFVAGSPAQFDASFQRVADIPAGIEWLPDATPLLRNANGRVLRTGEPVYTVVSGPLAGFDLVLAGCRE